jgi:hypothetical protein
MDGTTKGDESRRDGRRVMHDGWNCAKLTHDVVPHNPISPYKHRVNTPNPPCLRHFLSSMEVLVLRNSVSRGSGNVSRVRRLGAM